MSCRYDAEEVADLFRLSYAETWQFVSRSVLHDGQGCYRAADLCAKCGFGHSQDVVPRTSQQLKSERNSFKVSKIAFMSTVIRHALEF